MWDGVRNFWCNGKLQTGPDTKNLIIVILLINGINAMSLGFSWQAYLFEEQNAFPLLFGLILVVLIDFFMYKAATSDPGLIPKQVEDEHIQKFRGTFKNYLMVDGLNGQKAYITRLKFCYSC